LFVQLKLALLLENKAAKIHLPSPAQPALCRPRGLPAGARDRPQTQNSPMCSLLNSAPAPTSCSSKTRALSLLCEELCEKSGVPRGRNAPELGAGGLQPLSAALHFHHLLQQALPKVAKSPPCLTSLPRSPSCHGHLLPGHFCALPLASHLSPSPGRDAPEHPQVAPGPAAPCPHPRPQPASGSERSSAVAAGRCTARLGAGAVSQLGSSWELVPRARHRRGRVNTGLVRRGTGSGAGHE